MDITPEKLILFLKEKGLTVATAESCTGGLIAKMITDVPGASAVFEAGAVTYSNRIKTKLLGVDESLLRTKGAVCAETAEQMARGAARISDADVAVAVTGIAGPGGGSPEKPVGLVHMATYISRTDTVRHYVLNLSGDRALIRLKTAQQAIQVLYDAAREI